MADVAIIGGGPAGLACAIRLALKEIPVVIYEPQPLPIDKPCGEGIMPDGVQELDELGILPMLDHRYTSWFNGVCFISEHGHRAVGRFHNGHGLGCRRLALSEALSVRCKQFSKIEIVQESAKHLERTKKSITVIGERSSRLFRLVIGADGLRSRVRAGIGHKIDVVGSMRYGMRQHFVVAPWSKQVEVYFKPGIEAYVTPCGDDQTNITFLWQKDFTARESRVCIALLLKHFPALSARIAGRAPASPEMAIGPLHQGCISPVSNGVVLVGDASGYFDAITGEGISIALRQASALSDLVASILKRKKSGMLSARDLMPYVDAHRDIVKLYYRNTGLLLWLAQRPRIMEWFIKFGEKNPRAFSWMIETSKNEQSWWPRLPILAKNIFAKR